MTRETKPVGGQRAWEMLVGESETGRWTRPIVRYSGFLFLGLLFLVIWLPSKGTLAGMRVLLWGIVYFVYLIILEILCRQAKHLYETRPFQLSRIHFNLAMIAILALVAPPTASSYLWFFFAMPLLATLGYFGRSPLLLIVYLEVCVAILIPTLAEGWPTPIDLATMVAKDIILGLLTALLYFFVHLSPRLREESTLLRAATTLIQVLDQKEICQLLADAAKAGVPASDAAVVHLLAGEDNRTLVPMGSSHLDLTTLGKSPMEIGVGIAGHAIQSHKTINVPNVDEDDRYHKLPPSFIPFTSLLVAPMYVGEKNVGTISVHSARTGAFGKRDERFLTMLAAQGGIAIANAELYDIRRRRRQQISDILEASLTFGLEQPLDSLLETIATAVCRCSGYRMAVVNLLDEASGEIVVRAMAGVPPEGKCKLEGLRTPLDTVMPLLQDEFCISRSYFIRHDRCPEIPDLDGYTFTADLGERKPGEWHQEDMLIVPIQTHEEKLLGYISVDDPSDRQLPSRDTIQALEVLTNVAATAIQNARLIEELPRRSAEKAREDAIRAERARLETDLHEAMNVLATGVRWESEILSDQLSCSDLEAARTTLERLQAARTRAYADLHYLLEDLRDPTLEREGLLVALRKRAEVIGGGRISVHGELDKRLPPEIEGMLYRVGQEAMSNAVKHSGVAHNPDVEIELHLECSERQVKLWVKDNGEGFDMESTLGLSHKWALRRLRDNLREMGGNLVIDSAPRQGATICATIDLTRRSDA